MHTHEIADVMALLFTKVDDTQDEVQIMDSAIKKWKAVVHTGYKSQGSTDCALCKHCECIDEEERYIELGSTLPLCPMQRYVGSCSEAGHFDYEYAYALPYTHPKRRALANHFLSNLYDVRRRIIGDSSR